MKDNRKIFRPVGMDQFFKRNTPNRFLDGAMDVDYYRKVGDRPEITPRIPILNLEQLQQDQSAVGTIKVDTNPQGADFYLLSQGNEISLGNTSPSLTITDMPVGTYNYSIKKQDYNDYKGQVTVLDGEICCVDVDLKSAQKNETCQPMVSPEPTPSQQPSGFFISDRDILKMVGLIGLGILVGYLIGSRRD